MQKFLIVLGLILVAVGLLWPLLEKSGLGRLPGDIVLQGERSTLYFPIVTCLLISIILSALFWLFNR